MNPSGHLPITFPAAEAQAPRPAPVGLAQMAQDSASSNPGAPGSRPASFPVDYPEGADVGYRWYAKTGAKPLFPFGFGLSYTHFAYSNLKLTGNRTLTVSFDVTNTGDRAGADVPQIYATPPAAGAVARLVGFERVTLQPGQTLHVTRTAELRVLGAWDETAHGFHVSGGRYAVAIGHNAADTGLHGDVEILDQRLKP